MDFDGSLTPPLSPGLMDSEPLEASPVLLVELSTREEITRFRWTIYAGVTSSPRSSPEAYKGKHRRNLLNTDATDQSEGGCNSDTEYISPVECKPRIYGRLYSSDCTYEDTLIGRAVYFWNSIPMLELGDSHICNECKRNVMGQKRCLKELDDMNQAMDIFYEALMYFQDLDECAKEWARCTTTQSSHHVAVAKKYRIFINEALSFVCEYIQQSCERDESCRDSLVNIVHLMVMMCSRSQDVLMNEVKSIIREDLEVLELGGKPRTSPLHELLHVQADINSTLLKMLPKISANSAVFNSIDSLTIRYDNQACVIDKEFHWRVIKSIFSQIMKLSIEKFLQLSRKANSNRENFVQTVLFHCSPFTCLCFQELASLCLHVVARMRRCCPLTRGCLDSMDTQTNAFETYDNEGSNTLDCASPGFWKMMSTYINAVIQGAQNKKPNNNFDESTKGPEFQQFDTLQDALSFCWWWAWHAAHLFSFDSNGNYQAKLVTSSACIPLLSRLLRLSLTSCEGDQKLLASHLICYQAISSFWRNSSSAPEVLSSGELAHFYLLWAHFSKKLNNTKKSEKLGIHKYTVKDDKSISPNAWIFKCEIYLKYQKSSLADDFEKIHEDSFKIFLSIFGELLQIGCWNSIKDRFFSRLSVNEIKNLSDVGLSRLIQTFLIISLSRISNDERVDVLTKLLDQLNSTYLSRTDFRKQKVMLNGLFACMPISIRFSIKLQHIATKCGKITSLILKLFAENTKNIEHRNSLWKIIRFYFQNLTEVVQVSRSFDFFQNLLIPTIEMQNVFSSARSTEVTVVLECLASIFSSLSSHVDHSPNRESFNGCAGLFKSICTCFLPWIKDIVKANDAADDEVVNAVIEMCNFSVQMIENLSDAQSSALPVTPASLVDYFGCTIQVRLRTRFLFLVGLLSHENRKLLVYLNKQNAGSNAVKLGIIQGAIKCIVSISNKEDQDHMMRCLVSLNDVKEILQSVEIPENDGSFATMLQALENRYKACKTLAEQKEQVDQVSSWFNPLSDVVRSVAKSYATTEQETLINIYRICALIAKHCYGMLYSRGSSWIIVQIFDFIVLPRWVYLAREKSIHPGVLKALAQTLHVYIKTLLSIESPGDNYIKRVLADLISIYLTRFPAGTNSATHPFRRALASSDLTTNQRCILIRNIRDSCLKGPDTNTKLSAAIEILHSWTECLTGRPGKDEATLILPLLERAHTTLKSSSALTSKVEKLFIQFA